MRSGYELLRSLSWYLLGFGTSAMGTLACDPLLGFSVLPKDTSAYDGAVDPSSGLPVERHPTLPTAPKETTGLCFSFMHLASSEDQMVLYCVLKHKSRLFDGRVIELICLFQSIVWTLRY